MSSADVAPGLAEHPSGMGSWGRDILSAVPLRGAEYRNASGMGFPVIEQERRGTADAWRSGGGLEEAPDLGVRLQQLFSAAPAHSSRIIHMWRTYWSRTLPKASS
ncbi:unnamed protein product [Gadus morhua 'NCC']